MRREDFEKACSPQDCPHPTERVGTFSSIGATVFAVKAVCFLSAAENPEFYRRAQISAEDFSLSLREALADSLALDGDLLLLYNYFGKAMSVVRYRLAGPCPQTAVLLPETTGIASWHWSRPSTLVALGPLGRASLLQGDRLDDFLRRTS